MLKSKDIVGALALLGVLASGSASATLFDRGGGLLYDDVLNVTWLQDANYAQTSGYDADGRMTWAAANTWATTLVYHDSVRNVNLTGWRLPRVAPVDPSGFDGAFQSRAGDTDFGYNITRPSAELSYMYYVNLGLKGYYSPTGDLEPNFGVFGDGTVGGQGDVGLVRNLQSFGYWYETNYAVGDVHVVLVTFDGSHGGYDGGIEWSAWAVRPGDVAAVVGTVPEPISMALFGLGLAGLAMVRHRSSLND